MSDRTGVDALAIRILAVFGAVAGIPVYLGYAVLWSILPLGGGDSHVHELKKKQVRPVWIAIAGTFLLQFTPLAAPITLFLILGAALSGSAVWALIAVSWVVIGAILALLSFGALLLFIAISPNRMHSSFFDEAASSPHSDEQEFHGATDTSSGDTANERHTAHPLGASEWAVRQRTINDAQREIAHAAETAAVERSLTMSKYRSRSPRQFVTWSAVALGLAAGAIGTSVTWNSFTAAGALLLGGAAWMALIGIGALVNAFTGRRTGWHMPVVHIASCFAVVVVIVLCAFPDGIPNHIGWGTRAKVLPASAEGSECLLLGPVNDVTLTDASGAQGMPTPLTRSDVANSATQGIRAIQGNLTVRLTRDIPSIVTTDGSGTPIRLTGDVGSLPHKLKRNEILALCPGSDPKILERVPEHWADVCSVGLSSYQPSTPSTVVDDYASTIAYETVAVSAPFGTVTIDLERRK